MWIYYLLQVFSEVEEMNQVCKQEGRKWSSSIFFYNAIILLFSYIHLLQYDNSGDMIYGGHDDSRDHEEGHRSPVISALENEGRVYLRSREQVRLWKCS